MKKFTKLNENSESSHMDFDEAFSRYIVGQTVKHETEINIFHSMYRGMLFENGYAYVSHGGGCSGEDCNNTSIVSPNGDVISSRDW